MAGAGSVDVRFVTNLTSGAIKTAAEAAIDTASTSNDADLAVVSGAGGESIIILAVGNS